MDTKEKVLATMKEAGLPLNAGKIADLSGLDRKEVDAAMKQLKAEGLKDFPKDFPKESMEEITDRQRIILSLVQSDCTLTSQKISQKISEKEPVTQRTIKKDIADLQSKGILSREGGRKNGRWVITNKNDNKNRE